MNNLFKNTEWLGSITVAGVSLSDIALIVAWLFVLMVYVGGQWPGRSKQRSTLDHTNGPANSQQ